MQSINLWIMILIESCSTMHFAKHLSIVASLTDLSRVDVCSKYQSFQQYSIFCCFKTIHYSYYERDYFPRMFLIHWRCHSKNCLYLSIGDEIRAVLHSTCDEVQTESVIHLNKSN